MADGALNNSCAARTMAKMNGFCRFLILPGVTVFIKHGTFGFASNCSAGVLLLRLVIVQNWSKIMKFYVNI